jgi:hypothetical protein
MFLTGEELKELTGFARAAKQLEWLRTNGWKFAEDAQRRPKVARTYFELRLGGVASPDTRAEATISVMPCFDALRAVAKQGARHGA